MQKFDDNKNIKTYKDFNIVKRLAIYMKPIWGYFILALVLTAVIVFVDLLPAFLEGRLIGILGLDLLNDNLEYLEANKAAIEFANKIMSNFSWTLSEFKLYISLLLVLLYTIIIIIAAFINYYTKMILQKSGQKIVMKLRKDTFVHIESLSIAQINSTPVGKLVTRVTSDINMINELYTNVIVNLIRYVLTIIFVIVMMLIISPILTFYLAITAPILLIISFIFNKVSRKQYRRVRGCVSNVNAFLSENISGMKITQIFNQEDKKLDEFRQKNNDLRKNSIKEVLIFGVFRPAIYVLYVICQIIVLYNGFTLIKKNKLLLSNYVTFYQYISSFFNPIQQLAEQFNQLQSAFASAERVFAILDTNITILDSNDAIDIDHFEGKIEFEHVWFAYNNDNWILKDVTFTVLPKQTVAFVGATGAGKTTILALIVRNYEIQKGEIRIDGIPVNKIKIESLRKHIGQMLQDVFLFSGSIRSNITLREEAFTNDEIISACKYVNADKFISKLDGGLDYQVLERGVNFSSGQRQLLSFARTIIHKPSIMILDEATANIDTETEVLIQDSLEKMMNIGTMLIVAHRLSTIQHADNIIVLHKGKIMESGNHQELLAKHGLYYNLYELQYKHMEK
ncbi:MAG: ABC transporter ATP-binding protein [Anaeroplasma sp.]